MNFSGGSEWLPGVIKNKSGPVSYQIQLDDGRMIRRHQDPIISRHWALPDDGDDVSNVPFETRQHQYPTVAEPSFPAAELVAHSTGDTQIQCPTHLYSTQLQSEDPVSPT